MQLREELQWFSSKLENDGGTDTHDPFSISETDLFVNADTGEFSFHLTGDVADNLKFADRSQLQSYLSTLESDGRFEFWQKVKLGSVISVAAFDMLSKQVAFEYKKLKEELPYSFSTLAKVEDFRTMLGLYYLVKMAKEFHIRSTLEPVLSFPLGSNVVTLLESTRMYEALVTGKIITYGSSGEEENSDSLAIIDRSQ